MALNPGKYAHIFTAGRAFMLGSVPVTDGTGAPAAANAMGKTEAAYIRTGTGSASTMIYVTADAGVTWQRVTFA